MVVIFAISMGYKDPNSVLPSVQMSLSCKIIPSPLGPLTLVADQNHLVAILWENEKMGRVKLPPMKADPRHPILIRTENQLIEFFSGTRKTFEIPIRLQGTLFQNKVWSSLSEIPFGETRTYSQMAEQINAPQSTRAVGGAIGKNPLSIILPCHRVIGKSGKLTGFAGGMKNKTLLLELEKTA